MADEIEDNDNLEPNQAGAPNEPPTVFASGQAPVNLAKRTANKLDWMMPDYADEDARGEGKAIAGLAEQLESAASEGQSSAQAMPQQAQMPQQEQMPQTQMPQTQMHEPHVPQAQMPQTEMPQIERVQQPWVGPPQADSATPAKIAPSTFAEQFEHGLIAAPDEGYEQVHEPVKLEPSQFQHAQQILESIPAVGAPARIAPEPVAPQPEQIHPEHLHSAQLHSEPVHLDTPHLEHLHPDHGHHQSIDEFTAAPSSIHFLKPPEAPLPTPEQRHEVHPVPLPELPKSLDTNLLSEAGPITPAPSRPVVSKRQDSVESAAPVSHTYEEQSQTYDEQAQSGAFGAMLQPGATAAREPVSGSHAASESGADPGKALGSGARFGPMPANQSGTGAGNSKSEDVGNNSGADSDSKPAAPRKSRLPRSIAAPVDQEPDDQDAGEQDPVPHGRSFRKLPPSRTSSEPLPMERSLKSSTSKVAVIIAVSVLIGVGVGVGFLANLKPVAKTEGTVGGADSGTAVMATADRPSKPGTIDTTGLGDESTGSGSAGTGGKAAGNSLTSLFGAPVSNQFKTIEEARDAGDKQIAAGNYENARKIYTAALAIDAHDMTSMHKRGLSNYLLGNNTAALFDLNKVLERDHRYLPALLDRAATYYKLGEYKKAQADYDLVFAIDRGNRYALLGMSMCKSKQNLSEEALKTLSRLTFGHPDYIGGYEAAGYEFLKTGDYQRAAVAFSKAIGVAPDNDTLYALRARSYLLAGDKARAVEDYNRAISLCKTPANQANYKHDLACAQGAN